MGTACWETSEKQKQVLYESQAHLWKASHMVALLHSTYLEFIQNADLAALTSPDPSRSQQTIFTAKQTAMGYKTSS